MNLFSDVRKFSGIICLVLLFIFQNAYAETVIAPSVIIDQSEERNVPAQRFIWQSLLEENNYRLQLQPSALFSCFGVAWDIAQPVSDKRQLTISYRTKDVSGNWTEWQQAEADFTPEQTPTGFYWTDALFTSNAESHTVLEIVLSLPVSANKIIVDVFDGNINATPTPEGINLQQGGRSCVPFPSIITRAAWCGGSAPCSNVNAAYNVTNINPTHVVIHHGASPNTYTDGQAIVRSYWNYHVNSLGWLDIGYNFLIDKYGNFYQGRHNPNLLNNDVRGSHAGNANNGSIGVNFLGNADVTIATQPQLNKLYELLAWWFNRKSFSPTSSAGMQTQDYGWQTVPRITGHRDIGQTTCPGNDLHARLSSIRNATNAIINNCGNPVIIEPPTTSIDTTGNKWKSNDFYVDFFDTDNNGYTALENRFYQALEYNGTEWRANNNNGFFNDNFNQNIHADWSIVSGNWTIQNGHLLQQDENENNSNISVALTQNNENTYLYQWSGKISGSGNNRRQGLHFFASDAQASNRGESYLAWFRADDNTFQFYKITNNVLNTVLNSTIIIDSDTWYDFKVTYNPVTGTMQAFINNALVGSYTDNAQITTGSYISLRNGNSIAEFDDLKVWKSRGSNVLVTVGNDVQKDVRFESPDNIQEACRINSIVIDSLDNWSSVFTSNYFIDYTEPITTANVQGNWQTESFNVTYNDIDNATGSGVARRFYQVSSFNGSKWIANANNGFFTDSLTTISSQWNVAAGTWNTANGFLQQNDETITNTNIYASLNQTLSNRYYYSFDFLIDGVGNNRRGGFHFFCDDASLSERGNSYFIWFRIEDETLEFYKVTNNVFSRVKIIPLKTIANQWYKVAIVYDRITGELLVYRNQKLVGEWKDSNPIIAGNAISFRSGNSIIGVKNFEVLRTRLPSTLITVGVNSDVVYENINPVTPAASIKTLITDSAQNLSAVSSLYVNIDFTQPENILWVNDGLGADIDSFFLPTELSCNWSASNDINSDILRYWISIGTSAGEDDILSWTDVDTQLSYTLQTLSITPNLLYYINVKAENGAGLFSEITSSNGQQWLVLTSSTEMINSEKIKLYPSPFEDIIYIEPIENGIYNKAILYDAAGKIILTEPINTSGKTKLTLPQTSAGKYFLKVYSDENELTFKLLKVY